MCSSDLRNPLGRIGRTEDVAAAAVYLASPATSFMTGAVIPLDGGLSTTIGIHLQEVSTCVRYR